MMNVLVTGGSGFIGSAVVEELLYYGYKVTILDRALNPWTKKLSEQAEILNFDINEFGLFTYYKKFDAIIHMAANHVVPESVSDPYKFYHNNLESMRRILAYAKSNSTHIVFSSSAAVYDIHDKPVIETDNLNPINPYGETKLWSERMIQSCSAAYGFNGVSLRYFNVAGATRKSGYYSKTPTHAIPVLLKAVKNDAKFTIFGNDYSTEDGTCVRDYLHVRDVARAHVLALEYLNNNGKTDVFNLGTGVGCSMKQLVQSVESVLDTKVNVEYGSRRFGDPPFLVANADKATKILNWKPEHEFADIIRDSWNWENANNDSIGK